MKFRLIILTIVLMGSLGLNAGSGADECVTEWLRAQEAIRQQMYNETSGRMMSKGLSKKGCLGIVISGAVDIRSFETAADGARLEYDLTDDEKIQFLEKSRELYDKAFKAFYDCLAEKDSEFQKYIDETLKKIIAAKTDEDKRKVVTKPDGSYYSDLFTIPALGFIFDLAERERARLEKEG